MQHRALRDDILAVIEATSQPITLALLSHTIGEREREVRAACESADKDGKLVFFRRGRGGVWYVGRTDCGVRRCVICSREFTAIRKQTKTCSYSCARHLAYQDQDMRRRHRASAKRAAQRAERIAQITRMSRALCSDPKEIARRSEQNRKSWADPESRTRRLISIKESWKGPKAAVRIGKARRKKLALWSDPDWREKTVNAMRTGKRGSFKRAVIALAGATPQLSEEQIAAKLSVSVAQVKIQMRRAHKTGELARRPADGRKREHTPEEIRNRVAKTLKTKMRRGTIGRDPSMWRRRREVSQHHEGVPT